MSEQRQQTTEKATRERHRRSGLFLGLLAVFLLSGGLLLRNWLRAEQEREAHAALARQVHAVEAELASQGGGALPTVDGVLPQYQDLWERNEDLAGWVSIPGTAIDYPVMHTAQDEESYLRRAFDGSGSDSGTPFLAADCFAGCGNYIVYGHNMKDGSMFADLLSYADPAFWEQHPAIRFDTLDEAGTYEVLAAFYADVALRDAETFAAYLELVEGAALYDTGVTAEPGDQLLTLSTCSYRTSDERFVVAARRMA